MADAPMSGRRSSREGFPLTLTLLALVVMSACMATLLWLEVRFRAMIEEDINKTASVFAQSGALGEPLRREGVRYLGALLPLIEANRRGFIRDIYVTKELSDGSEHLLAPVLGWNTMPDWRERIAGWERRELRSQIDDALVGRLFFDIDRSVETSVAWAARGVGLLIALALALLLTRLWGTRRVLGETVDALTARQRELIHIERLALAGQLTANVLHDIKKPVLNIRHGIKDLREALGEYSGVRRALGELEEQTNLFQSILRETNLERFVQARDDDQEFLDVNEVLRQAAGLVRYERRDVDLRLDMDGGAPPVHASRHRLIQVFSNLILNAYQALDGKGTLTLRTRSRAGAIGIEIEDDGPGLAKEVRENLFRPFVTTKPTEEGTGLGLMICRMIIEEVGGTISGDNRTEGGARFRIELPAGDRR